ncbi:MAG TPA: hypothetical protein VH518_15720 [Tepidisphaeraceae bacterium]|jgi:hypothetical protein
MLKSLPILLLMLLAMHARAWCGPTTSSTSPATAPATQPISLSITCTVIGGIAGTTKITTFATADVQFDPPRSTPVTRLSPAQAQAVADLLGRESVLSWSPGIKGRGEYFDNMHYFLDVNLNGQQTHIHAADFTNTAPEAHRIQQLMSRINNVVSASGR